MMLAKSSKISIQNGKMQHTLSGRSRAGEATAFAVPELKWFFDCGALVEGWQPKVVFLTHTHGDHSHYLTHVRNEDNPPLIFLPVEANPFVQSYMDAYQEMIECTHLPSCSEDDSGKNKDFALRPVQAGEEIAIHNRGSDFVVRILQMDHRISCVGYSIFKVQNKLKKEYEDMPGKEIGMLKKKGVEVTEPYQEPFLCFLGDTTSKVFKLHPEILEQHQTIVVECSFIDEGSLDRASATTHMHWFDLKPVVERNLGIFFILTHFSLKYSSLELRQFFCEQQSFFDNIHPMLIDEEVEEIWARRFQKDSTEQGKAPKCMCRLCRAK